MLLIQVFFIQNLTFLLEASIKTIADQSAPKHLILHEASSPPRPGFCSRPFEGISVIIAPAASRGKAGRRRGASERPPPAEGAQHGGGRVTCSPARSGKSVSFLRAGEFFPGAAWAEPSLPLLQSLPQSRAVTAPLRGSGHGQAPRPPWPV